MGFDVQGHSGWGQRARTSSAPPSPAPSVWSECTVNDVMGLCASVKIREKDAKISFRLPGGLSAPAESTCQESADGAHGLPAQLHDEYPENIEVMEE